MKRLYKVAMVAPCPFPLSRGTPIRIFRMAEALSQRGHDIHVVTYHLGDNFSPYPFSLHRIPHVKSYNKYSPGPTYQKLMIVDFLLAKKLREVLNNNEIDLIHAHHYEGLFVASWARRKTKHPLVYDAHTLLETELPFYGLGLPKKIKQQIGRKIDQLIPGWPDHIISVTDGIKRKYLAGGLSPKDITVITSGVECDHFTVKPENARPYHHSKKTIVYSGNLAAFQGIDLLLRAFKKVFDTRPDVRLLIISDYPFDDYEPLANALNIREHIDIEKSDFNTLPRYLAGADVALNTRVDFYGSPQKLLNYMAAGKPIVSFEGSAKNIEHDKTGLVVENGNIPAFAKAILQLLDNHPLAEKLGANAQEFAASEFSWDRTAEQVETVYESLLRGKPK